MNKIHQLKQRYGYNGKPKQWQMCFDLMVKELLPDNKSMVEHEKSIDEIALHLLPTVYQQAIVSAKDPNLFQYDDWRTGLVLDAYLLAEAYLSVKAFKTYGASGND